MFKTVFLLLLLALVVQSRIQIPFVGSIDKKFGMVHIGFNASVGTPAQNLQFELASGPFWYIDDLYVRNKDFLDVGFDPEKSKTFRSAGNVEYNVGNYLNGTDTITLGGQNLESKPIQVVNRTDTNYFLKNRMGVNRFILADMPKSCVNGTCTSFIQSVMSGQKEQVLVLAFDKIQPDIKKQPFNGQMVLGERPIDLCGNDWTFLPELEDSYGNLSKGKQWTFNVSSVSVGKYGWKNSKDWAVFGLTDTDLVIPKNVYIGLLKTINGTDNELPCDATANIVLNLGGKEVIIKPDVYLHRMPNKRCNFAGMGAQSQRYILPIGVLSEYCLAFNYEKFGVEITERVN